MHVCVVVRYVIRVVMTTSCVAMLVLRARLFNVRKDGLLTRVLPCRCALVRCATLTAMTTSCAAMLVQRARLFSVLTAGLLTRVLLNHYVLVGRAIIRALITTCVVTSNRSRHRAPRWSVHQPLMLLTAQQLLRCVSGPAAMLALLIWTPVATLVLRVPRWSAHQPPMLLTAQQPHRCVSGPAAMLALLIWTPAAIHVRHALRFHAVQDGLQTAMPHLRCALDLLVTRAQEIWRHVASRTRALRFRSQAVLWQTTQVAMAVLRAWSSLRAVTRAAE